MDCHAVSSVCVDMDRLDQAQELMAEATALLEDACSAAVEGQGASSSADICDAATRVITLSNNAIATAQSAAALFTE
tara:strand:+ start:929 stop:1159 length:231 start_codon:yes stop_codon:yes gene_type:complete